MKQKAFKGRVLCTKQCFSKAEKFTLNIDYLTGTAAMARVPRRPQRHPAAGPVAEAITANPSPFSRLCHAWVLELAGATGVRGAASSGLGKHMLYSYK